MSENSVSFEEANRIRLSLGLKPLKAGPESSSAQIAEDNMKRHREDEAKRAHEDTVKSRIAKSKNKLELNKTMSGKGLGEASDDDDDGDLYKWTMKSRKKEKERQAAAAAKREKELQELDDAYQAEYDEDQLAGLRVGHDMSDFAEGEERILTLKDSTILENEEEGDELINIQMTEQQRLEKNLENKKKKNRPVYSAYDDDEFTSGKKKNLLSQYDEVLGTEQGNDGFVIGKARKVNRGGVGDLAGSSSDNGGLTAKEIMNQKLKESAIALTYNKTQQAQDYYTKDEAEITFKKSKKKKKSRSRKADNWDEEGDQEGNAMEVERPEPVDISELNFVDDEDLQASLAKARRLATKKTIKKLTPEQIAKNLAESKAMEVEEDFSERGGLVISDVSEFVSNLASSSAVHAAPARPTHATKEDSPEPASTSSPTIAEKMQEDTVMEDTKEEAEEDNFRSRTRAESEEAEDSAMKESNESEQAEPEAVLAEEPLVSRGLGSTLALLKQKGALEMGNAEQAERSKIQSERARWLADARLREARLAKEMAQAKARDKEKVRDKNYSIRDRDRDREYENQRREQQLLDEREARMKNYQPDIKLEYIDDSGNRLNTKEAFRQLSHAFHGKTSGKMKTEKRMKKLEDEKRLMSMSSTDTPLGMASAFQERQKAAGSAHIVLAVGNRKYVSHLLIFIEFVCAMIADFNTNLISSLPFFIFEQSSAVPASLASSTVGGTTSTLAPGSGSGTASTATAKSQPTSFLTPSQNAQATMSISGVHAPNREKVTFGLKRKAEAAPGSNPEETAPKKTRN
ncbi:MAG: SART-1 family-domain-containing protein [Linnemannia elongata]|nr:MAG: SART-1 family-domain-containing protein [Linnemannia elongata]